MEKDCQEFLNKIIGDINEYIEYLASMGLELNEDGDIIEKDSKKLLLRNFEYE